MKKQLIILLSFCALTAYAQQPDWVNPILREKLYPSNVYYTGFSSTYINKSEDKETIYNRVQQNARIEAVSSIQVTVEQIVERYIKNIQVNSDVSTKDIMMSYASTQTGIKDIPGLKVEMWENSKTGEVYAFAWVKATNLYKQLMRRIVANNAKAEVELEAVETMANRGDKVLARKNLSKVQDLIDDIENDQRIMLSIDANVTNEDMAVEETNLLKKRYQALTAELKNGINLSLICYAYTFEESYPLLKEEIQGELSKMGCNFITGLGNPDWTIYISAKAREYNKNDFGSVSTYFVYVDANVIVEKTATGQRIYENQISEKGGHTHNYEQAARQAYKDISPKICEIIKEQIK